MRTRVALLAAALLALWVADRAPALTSGDGVWPSPLDFGSSWIASPHDRSSGGVQLWTRARVAAMDGAIVTIGSDEQTLNLPNAHEIPGLLSSDFDLNFTTSGVPKSTDNLLLYMADVRARVPAGHDGPLFFYDTRPDLIFRNEADGTGLWAPESDWFLRTDRLIADFAGWFDGLGSQWSWCRSPNLAGDATESWDAAEGGTGCNRTFASVSGGEFGIRLHDLIEDAVPGLGDDVAYYTARPESAAEAVYYPYAVLANMLDPEYQDSVVDRCAHAISIGWDGCYLPHKNHYYWNNDGTDAATRGVEHWIDVGDGLSGYSSSAGNSGCTVSGTLDTLAELFACETLASGPPELPDGTPFLWDEYALGQVEIARKLNTAGVPYFRIVNPYWYEDCDWGPDHAAAQMPGTWTDASCANEWNDSGTANNEAAFLREIVQRAAFVMIDLGGKSTGSESIGSGGGSGFSFADLKWILENPASGPAPRVLGFYNPGATNGAYATPPKLSTDPSEDNPMAERIVAAATTIVPSFVAEYAQGSSSCTTPCDIFVDATTTTDSAVTDPFSELDYAWDCGDANAGTFQDGSSRRYRRGPITGCVYEESGTKTITLTVTNRATGESATTTDDVTVSPITSVFSGANIHCFSNDTDHAGCPSGGTTHDSVTSFSSALSTCNAVSNKRACLFRRGDSFSGGGVALVNGSVGTIGLIGAYGTGADPVVTSYTTAFTPGPNWVVSNLNITGDGSSDAFAGVPLDIDRFTVHEVKVTNIVGCYASQTGGGTRFNTLEVFSDFDCTRDPAGGGTTLFFYRGNKMLLLGGTLDTQDQGEFNFRTVGMQRAAIQNVHMPRPGSSGVRNAIQLRAWAQATTSGTYPQNPDAPSGTGPAPQSIQYVVIGDNVLEWNSDNVIRLAQNNTTSPASEDANHGAGTPMDVVDILVERNFVRSNLTYGSTHGMTSGFVTGQGGRVTVRNNILDLQGIEAGGVVRIVNQTIGFTDCAGCVEDGWKTAGNTVYYDEDFNQDLDFCTTVAGSGHTCDLNLTVRPNDETVGTPDTDSSSGDDWTIGTFASEVGNVRAASGFATTIGAEGATSATDFTIDATSAARDEGTPGTSLGYDFCMGLRPSGASHDAGAWEFGALCRSENELVGVNGEKLEHDEEAIVFADALNNTAQIRAVADPTGPTYENFWRTYRDDLTTLDGATIPVDNLGWPTVTIPYHPGANDLYACTDLMVQDSGRPIAYPTGSYTLQFDGTGEVRVLGTGTVTCTGTDASCAVTITPSSSSTRVCITDSDQGSDPITRVRLMLPGYSITDTFYEPFVRRLAPFGFVRSLNFVQANHYPCSNLVSGSAGLSTCVHTWAGRAQPLGIQSGRRGIAWENQIALAEAAGVNFWAVIPHAADDDYVSNLAALLKASSIPKIYAELTNEVCWGGFEQDTYFTNVGIDDHAPDWTCTQAYVERAADVMDLFDAEFTGADAARLVKVIGTQFGSTGVTTARISAINSATYNPTGASFDAVAVAPYFGGTLDSCAGGGICPSGTCVGGSEAGSACVVTEAQLLDDAEANLASIETYMDSQFALIDAEGMQMIAYEGGGHMDGSDSVSIDANDDPRMEDMIVSLFSMWKAAGGKDSAMSFLVRDFANWGALRYPTQPLGEAPKYRGLMRAIGDQ